MLSGTGGFIPDNILYLSYWYTSSELPIRLAFFWIAYQSTSIVSAFLAYGIIHMAGIDGLEGWRWYVSATRRIDPGTVY